MIAFAATFTVILFWSVITAFIGALSSVDSLKNDIPGFAEVIEEHPWVQTLIEQLSPLLLVIVGTLAPIILGIFTNMEGNVSHGAHEASLFVKLAWFQIVQTFFIFTLSGSLFTIMGEVFENPSMLPDLLGASIPGRSTVFALYVIIRTGLNLTLDLLRVSPVIFGMVHKYCAPQLTHAGT